MRFKAPKDLLFEHYDKCILNSHSPARASLISDFIFLNELILKSISAFFSSSRLAISLRLNFFENRSADSSLISFKVNPKTLAFPII